MSKSKKAVIVASIFIVVGVIIAFLSIAINGFHFPNGSVDLLGMKALPDYVKKTVQITDDFNAVDIAGEASTDVMIKNSDNGTNYIEYYDTDGLTNHAEVVDGVLTFRCEDKRTHHPTISLGFGQDTTTVVYLADKEYESIQVTTASGDIDYLYSHKTDSKPVFNASYTSLKTNSGDIHIADIEANTLTVKTTSGDISISNGSFTTKLELHASSGDIQLNHITTDQAEFYTISGYVSASDITANTSLSSNTTSGDIDMSITAADAISISATSGDIDLDLASDRSYNFLADTQSGDVDIPHGANYSEYECGVSTTSGDIRIRQE